MPQCWCWALSDWKMPSVINLMPTDIVSYLFLKLGSGSAKQAKLNPSVSGLFCDCVRPGAWRVFHILWAVGEMYKSSLHSRPLYQLLLLVLLGEQGKSYSTQLLSLSSFFFLLMLNCTWYYRMGSWRSARVQGPRTKLGDFDAILTINFPSMLAGSYMQDEM